MSHKDQAELKNKVAAASKMVLIGKKYHHYKNPALFYLVEGFEIREENQEVCIRYRALYDEGVVWNRLLSEWLKPALLNGEEVARFVLVQD